jgi:hypothetical protein
MTAKMHIKVRYACIVTFDKPFRWWFSRSSWRLSFLNMRSAQSLPW